MKYMLISIFMCSSLFAAVEDNGADLNPITKEEPKLASRTMVEACTVPNNTLISTIEHKNLAGEVIYRTKVFAVTVETNKGSDNIKDDVKSCESAIKELKSKLEQLKKMMKDNKELEPLPKRPSEDYKLPSDKKDGAVYDDRTKEPNQYLTKEQALARMKNGVSEPYILEKDLQGCFLDNGKLV